MEQNLKFLFIWSILLYPSPAALTPFLALVTYFPKTLTIKGNANNEWNAPSCLFSVKAFIYEEDTGCINEEATGAISKAAMDAIIAPRIPPFFNFMFYCFSLTIN